jgi:hypothetical protein
MYLSYIFVSADDRIVERYPDGFVRRFGRESTCVTDHYSSLLYRLVRTEDSRRSLAFTFTDETSELPEFAPGCAHYFWPFDFAAYVQTDKLGKKALIAASMQAACLWVAGKENWWAAPLERAYQTLIERNYVFEGISKKSWLSPNKKYRAKVYFNFDLDRIDLYAVLYRNRSKTELGRIFLGKEIPVWCCLPDCLRLGRWVTETDFRLRTAADNLLAADFSQWMQ